MSTALLAAALLSCTAIDGDTLRCAPPGQGQKHERVRLIAIDAPELPGHCRLGRACAPGNPFASKAALQHLVAGKLVRIERWKPDRWGRTLAMGTVGTTNLSCAQIRTGRAIYRQEWDWAGRVKACR